MHGGFLNRISGDLRGWDNDSINAVEIAKICEANGADAITVHGRTRAQMYAPPVNVDIIQAVKDSVKIPIIANGDIVDGVSAKEMYEKNDGKLNKAM